MPTDDKRISLIIQVLGLFGSVSFASFAGAPATHKYISPDHSFELTIPAGFGVVTDSSKGPPTYIPLCQDGSTVCTTYPYRQHKNYSFEGASVQVAVLPSQTKQACISPGKYYVSTCIDAKFRIDAMRPIRMIDGIRFLHAASAGAATWATTLRTIDTAGSTVEDAMR